MSGRGQKSMRAVILARKTLIFTTNCSRRYGSAAILAAPKAAYGIRSLIRTITVKQRLMLPSQQQNIERRFDAIGSKHRYDPAD